MTQKQTASNRRPHVTASILPLLLSVAACSGESGAGAASGSGTSESGGSQASTPAAAREPGTPALPTGSVPVDLDPAGFTAGSDHPYFPLEPGTQWKFREIDEKGAVVDVVVTVSSETREIANGIEAAVVRDTVTEDGELIEDTLDWYAQDADGNVWYLGEDTAEFEDGKLTSREGAWEADVDGALPGIIMPADPAVGMSYRQEYYAGKAEDNGEVLAVDQQAEVPAGHFDDVLMTADTIALEPDILEDKLYAPGVGVVMALGISGGGGREELVSTTMVQPEKARAAGTNPLGEPY